MDAEKYTEQVIENESASVVQEIEIGVEIRPVDSVAVDKTLRNNALLSLGMGVVPLPLVDFAALTAISLNLTRQLSKLYNVEFKEGTARKLIVSVIGAAVPTLASHSVATLLAGVPLIGLPLAVGTRPMLNAMSTYAVGRMFITHFERGGTFIGANTDEMKKDFSAAFKNSREWLAGVIGGQKAATESR